MIQVVLPILSVVSITTARVMELRRPRPTTPGVIRERWTLQAFVTLGFLMIGVGLVEFLRRGAPLDWPLFVAGWLVAIGSFRLRRSAITALGRFWSIHIEIREDHELVRSGPFRRIRHPTYLSMVLELTAVILIFQAWYTALAFAIPFSAILAKRIRLEESEMSGKLGPAFERYRNECPSMIPYKRL